MNLRLFVIEPQNLRRRLVCASAESAPDLTVVGEAASLYDPQVAETESPDLFLVDASLLTKEHEALIAVSRRYPTAFFVLFGTHPDVEALLSCLQLPVRGFLSFNHLTSDEFPHSLQVIGYGGAVIEPISAQLLLEYLQRRLPATSSDGAGVALTEREDEVLALVRRGLGNKEIAKGLGISLGTVRAHLRTIFRKLDVSSRAGAAAMPTTMYHHGKRAS
jgi:DNA-binding NarL/FixJ family response regulator